MEETEVRVSPFASPHVITVSAHGSVRPTFGRSRLTPWPTSICSVKSSHALFTAKLTCPSDRNSTPEKCAQSRLRPAHSTQINSANIVAAASAATVGVPSMPLPVAAAAPAIVPAAPEVVPPSQLCRAQGCSMRAFRRCVKCPTQLCLAHVSYRSWCASHYSSPHAAETLAPDPSCIRGIRSLWP